MENKFEVNAIRYLKAMKFFALLYTVGGLLFLLFPGIVETVLQIPEAIRPQRFWVVLATSMMAMLAATSFQAYRHPTQKAWLQIHLLSKFVSVMGFLGCWIWVDAMPAYLLGALVDAGVFVIVFWVSRGVRYV